LRLLALAAFVYFLMLALAPLALAAFGVYIYLCAQLEVQGAPPRWGRAKKWGPQPPCWLVKPAYAHIAIAISQTNNAVVVDVALYVGAVCGQRNQRH